MKLIAVFFHTQIPIGIFVPMIKKWIVLILVIGISMAFVVPKDFQYYYKKGFEAVEQGNNAAAIYYLDSAIALNPVADTAYSLIAYPYYYLNRADKAVEYCNKALAINPKNKYAYFIRGAATSMFDVSSDSLLKQFKKHKKDSVWVAKFLNQYFVADPAYVGFSGIYNYSKAINDISKCIELDSTYVMAYSYRAFYAIAIGRHKEAGKDYDRCIELDPKNAQHYLSRGKYREQYSSPGHARDDYTKGIALDPNLAELYEKRGVLYYNFFHDKEYACKDLRQATLLGRYIENLDTYCKVTELDTLLRYYGGRPWRHDYRSCVCPNPEPMFNSETDTIKEVEIFPGHKVKMLDIKDSEKTTWEFEDGRVIEISKTTEKRWLKEQEEKRKKDALIPIP